LNFRFSKAFSGFASKFSPQRLFDEEEDAACDLSFEVKSSP
jgi:hypothetical protein